MAEKQKKHAQEYTAFLRNLIDTSDSTIEEISEKIGITPSSIHHWFRSDDFRLSRLVLVSNAMGCDLQIAIAKKPYQLKGENPVFLSFAEMERLKLKKMYFLKAAMKDAGFTKVALAEKLGVTVPALTYWYTTDDITIKRLVACAEAMGRDLYLRVVRDDSATYQEEGTGIHMEVVKTRSWNVVDAISKR